MLILQENRFQGMPIPLSTSWLLAACMEARGRQDLYTRQRPEVLKALRDQAVIQSVESSNRIEGVTVDKDRLQPLVLGKARPRDRSEEEIAGYRKALGWLFTRIKPVPVEPKTILHLHKLAQGGGNDGGRWKTRDNEIVEILPTGERRVRFIPASAAETPRLIKELCTNYNNMLVRGEVPALILIATFIFDFLCIHPFRDGNGRVSRLLTTLLLQEHGFIAGRYVSLERLVEQDRDSYYEILHQGSQGWHRGTTDLTLWWNYFLGILKRAYDELAERVEAMEPSRKSAQVRQAIESQPSSFTLADIQAQCPSASPALIKKVLAEMKKSGKVRLTGRGRGARWENCIL